MKLYTIKEDSHKEELDEKKYVSEGFTNPQEIKLSDLDKLGFHFTPQRNSASISATGLKPTIGANAEGDLGKSAVEKTYFSRSIDGTMQIFNRVIHVAGEAQLEAFQNDKEKNVFLTESQSSPLRAEQNLSIIEAFEFARRYMIGNRYFVFNLTEPQYERTIDEDKIDAQVSSINERLDGISGITIDVKNIFTSEEIESLQEIVASEISSYEQKMILLNTHESNEKDRMKVARKKAAFGKVGEMLASKEDGILSISTPQTTIYGIDKLVDVLSDRKKGEEAAEQENLRQLIGKVKQLRAKMAIEIGRESKKLVVEEIVGQVNPISLVGANFTRIDYNDEAISWVDFHKNPHNCHTLVIDDSMGLQGADEPKGVRIKASDVRLLSLDGKEPANSIDIIQFMYNSLPEERRENFGMRVPGKTKDKVVIGKFLEYVDIYRDYKDSPAVFLEKIAELQESVAEEFPKYAIKASPEELKLFQEEMMQERKTDLHGIAKDEDDLEL